jgi:hypothetical protein
MRHAVLPALLAALAADARAETLTVTRAEVVARGEPRRGAPEVGRLTLGTKVEVTARRKRWRQVKIEEKAGWVTRGALAREMPSAARLCARGRSALSRGSLAFAVSYLRAAADRGTKDRACLEALAQAYRARGQSAEEAEAKARIRALDEWLVGTWCDAAQKIVLQLAADGTYDLKSDGRAVGKGRHELRGDELHLGGDRTGELVLYVRKRGVGRVLVARSTEELQRDFCPSSP